LQPEEEEEEQEAGGGQEQGQEQGQGQGPELEPQLLPQLQPEQEQEPEQELAAPAAGWQPVGVRLALAAIEEMERSYTMEMESASRRQAEQQERQVVAKQRGDRPPCQSCGRLGAAFRCERCLKVSYCGRRCQLSAWPGHQVLCSMSVM
jgi:hypothetical protein